MWIVQYQGIGWSKPMDAEMATAYIREMDAAGFVFSDCEKV